MGASGAVDKGALSADGAECAPVSGERVSWVRRGWVHLLLIVLLGAGTYAVSVPAPFIYDDEHFILLNPRVREVSNFVPGAAPRGPRAQFVEEVTRPVAFLTFALNYRASGYDPVWFRLTNVAIHLAAALLVYALVRLMFATPVLAGSRLRDRAGWLALGAALLFVAHPLQTQAVTFVTQRFASLATLFYLAAVVCYLRARLAGGVTPGSVLYYALALLASVLAMQTKEIAFTAPVMIGLLEARFLQGSAVRRLALWLPLGLTMLVIPLAMLGAGEGLPRLDEAARRQSELSRWTYLLTQFGVILAYLRLVVLPVGQNLDHEVVVRSTFFDTAVLGPLLALVLLFGAGLWLLLGRRGRDPAGALAGYAIVWVFVTLSVESSVVPLADLMFEHRMYLPSVGVFTAFALAAGAMLARAPRGAARRALVVSLWTLPVLLAALSIARNTLWRDPLALYGDTAGKSPGLARPLVNLGNAYRDRGDLVRAEQSWKAALAVDPMHSHPNNQLGALSYERGQYDLALRYFLRAAEGRPLNPEAYFNVATVLERLGRGAEAVPYLHRFAMTAPPYLMPQVLRARQKLRAYSRGDAVPGARP